MNRLELWKRYQQYMYTAPTLGLQLDISRMMFDEEYFEGMAGPMSRALDAMDELERGGKVNVDEDRMVGHYWLRAPRLAPTETIRTGIEQTIVAVEQFADSVHAGTVRPQRGDGFYIVLVIGIGGSALGPQLVCDALSQSDDPVVVRFIDNTDPDGIDRILSELDEALAQTLTVVVSKSGATIETQNAMLEVAAAYERAGLSFAKHAVAVTGEGSELFTKASNEKWLAVFPMWDWVGGRTSMTSAVGLLPAALLGVDLDALLSGARECDIVTRNKDLMENPAALLSLMWHYAGEGRGTRDMVVLPYRDRLSLLGSYLQQLVMESLGKKHNRDGNIVHQGLTVYGHKGTADQHAYIQQLQDGPNNFFVTFVNVRRDREQKSFTVEEDVTTGDYLNAFRQGTRDTLFDNGRESVTITLDILDAHRMGVLVSLFERAVGLYAELINVNAYNQPGVEAGKNAAKAMLHLQRQVLTHLRNVKGSSQTVGEIAASIGEPDATEGIYHILEHATANLLHGVRRVAGTDSFDAQYGAV